MKKILILIPALVFLIWTAQAQVSPPKVDPAVDQAITHLREGLVDSFNHGDIDKLLTFLDTNAVVTWQNGEVCEGTAAVKAYYNRMMKGDHPVVSKITSNPKVLGRLYQGDWAISWGELNDTFVLTDGRELPLNSKFTATVARRGEAWKVTAFHVSVNAFNNPITILTVKKVSVIVGIGTFVVGLIVGIILMRLLRGPKSGGAA